MCNNDDKIRITKEFHFEMSHCLNNYNGLCKNIHGHSYKLFVCVLGKICQNQNSEDYGMVMDFSKLKKIVQNQILEDLDHALMIEIHSPFYQNMKAMDLKKKVVDFQPTCENLVLYIKNEILKSLPQNLELFSVTLYETASSHATWCKIDNL